MTEPRDSPFGLVVLKGGPADGRALSPLAPRVVCPFIGSAEHEYEVRFHIVETTEPWWEPFAAYPKAYYERQPDGRFVHVRSTQDVYLRAETPSDTQSP